MINIPSYISDPNYRYKMPKMILKTESKGNGIKINITNLVDVADKLQTNPEYILKFIGVELGSQTTYTQVSKNNISCIIKGSFNYQSFIKVLDKFIDKYICCPKCKYPEMHMYVKKNKVMGTCDACGFDGELDSSHDIVTLILKKPPKQTRTIVKKGKTNEPEVIENEPEVTKKSKKTKLTKEELPLDGDKINQIIQKLQGYYKEISSQEQDSDILAAELTTQIKEFGIEKGLTDRLGYIIFNIIFDENISKQIKTLSPLYKLLMKKFIGENKSIETLLNLEYLYTKKSKNEDINKFAPTILKHLMENQIISEQLLKQWAEGKQTESVKTIQNHFLYDSERDNKFKQIVKPFTQWLLQSLINSALKTSLTKNRPDIDQNESSLNIQFIYENQKCLLQDNFNGQLVSIIKKFSIIDLFLSVITNMGGSIASSVMLGEMAKQYELIMEDQQQKLKFLEQRSTKQELVLREIPIKQSYLLNNLKQELRNKQRVFRQHSHLLEIVKYDEVENIYNCNSLPSLIIMSQYSQRTIDDQTSQRCLQRKPFTEEEIWTILASCILAFSHLQKNNIRHQCLRSSQIFISNDGVIKIKDPVLTGTLPNLQQLLRRRSTPHLYISPELCDSLAMSQANHTYDPHKSDVFTLAMIILEIGLLEYQDICYKQDWTVIDWVAVEDHWMKFRKNYSLQLSDLLMDCMLQKNPKVRSGWADLQSSIKKLEDVEHQQKSDLTITKKGRVFGELKLQQANASILMTKSKPVRTTSSQSPPMIHIINNASPRILSQRGNYHNRRTGSILEQTIVFPKSPSNSPTIQPIKLLQRKIQEPLMISHKAALSSRFPPNVKVQNSLKKRILQKSPKFEMKSTSDINFYKRAKEQRKGNAGDVIFGKTVKYLAQNGTQIILR